MHGGIAVRGPPKKLHKIAEKSQKKIATKIAVFCEGNCGQDLEKIQFHFRFYSGKWKGCQITVSLTMEKEKGAKNFKSKQGQNPAQNIISHICGPFSQIFDKNGGSNVDFKMHTVILNPF